ncbi:MAG: hypothetical protein Udaeo2_05360 [Candidatus Udaeobacter sp.]|nr:MAG: hypothetical protein Udaeo2_05360 [Candidatus Udaeobacter sp.]
MGVTESNGPGRYSLSIQRMYSADCDDCVPLSFNRGIGSFSYFLKAVQRPVLWSSASVVQSSNHALEAFGVAVLYVLRAKFGLLPLPG